MNAFAQALYDICLEEQSTATIEAMRNAALAKIAAGEVKSLVSSSLNGKSFSSNVSLPADKVFENAAWAIREYNRGNITVTVNDMTCL